VEEEELLLLHAENKANAEIVKIYPAVIDELLAIILKMLMVVKANIIFRVQ
jgi:hypothetical protein